MNLIVMGTVSRWFSILTRRLIDVLSFAKLVMDYFVESGDERWSVSTDSISNDSESFMYFESFDVTIVFIWMNQNESSVDTDYKSLNEAKRYGKRSI